MECPSNQTILHRNMDVKWQILMCLLPDCMMFRTISEEEIFERIDRSLVKIESGESRDADDVMADLMAELESGAGNRMRAVH